MNGNGRMKCFDFKRLLWAWVTRQKTAKFYHFQPTQISVDQTISRRPKPDPGVQNRTQDAQTGPRTPKRDPGCPNRTPDAQIGPQTPKPDPGHPNRTPDPDNQTTPLTPKLHISAITETSQTNTGTHLPTFCIIFFHNTLFCSLSVISQKSQ